MTGSARRTRRATARKRNGTTQAKTATEPELPPLDHFHLFPKLAIELQLMIWSFWRQDQPILRHYMSLFHDTRFYAAFDPSTKTFVRTTARSADSEEDDPLDPMEHKIRFTNQIQTVVGQQKSVLSVVLRSHSRYDEVGYQHLKPAFAWVNFEKDFFNIENINHRVDGRFRFLMHNIGAKIPKPLAPDHWASRIQTLTMRTECRPNRPGVIYGGMPYISDWYIMGDRSGIYGAPDPLTDVDDQVLQIMTSLKRILLVMPTFKLCPLTRPFLASTDATPGGFLDWADIEAAHKKANVGTSMLSLTKVYDCHCPAELTSTEVMGEMRQKLDGMGKQSVELKFVVDTVTTEPAHAVLGS
ncbi:hypothetical protein PG988_015409 [Apiospora saccharicola]